MPGTGTEPAPGPDKILNKLRNQEQVQEQFRFQHQDLPTLNEQILAGFITDCFYCGHIHHAPLKVAVKLISLSYCFVAI